MMSWDKAALSAFPPSYRPFAEEAGRVLNSAVDKSYRVRFIGAIACGRPVQIPARIHFQGLIEEKLAEDTPSCVAAHCLCSRSTDGHLRQSALRRILPAEECWAIPFIVLLSGEYVIEIAEDLVAALPTLNRDLYSNFVRENRPLMRLLRAKATSYWDAYYRERITDRAVYPSLAFLHRLEQWAA